MHHNGKSDALTDEKRVIFIILVVVMVELVVVDNTVFAFSPAVMFLCAVFSPCLLL